MKLAKRLVTMLLCACLVVPCLTMVVQAATPGKILLGEATAKAGDDVTVSLKAHVDAGIGNRTITISYDSSVLQFVSGTNTTKVSEGELKYESEQGINSLYNETELDKLTFKALKDGTAKISIKSAEVKSSFDITWTYYDGKVTVSGGTPVTSTPSTDTTTTETPDDATTEETEETEDDMMLGDVDAEVVISNTTTITLISDVSNVVLSERYAETTVMMEGTEYPAWQDTENEDMYIIYAASSNGIKSLYQYDTLENTYQRYEAAEETAVVSNDGILASFGDKANYVVIGAGALLGLFLILVIVLSVKLYNRNAELDEVYDDLDNALAEKDALKKEAVSRAKVMPVQVQTENDVMFTEEDEDDPEVEVEFYVDETVETVFEETVEVPVEKTPAQPVEYYDDEDDFYDDLDGDFSVSFIDLED